VCLFAWEQRTSACNRLLFTEKLLGEPEEFIKVLEAQERNYLHEHMAKFLKDGSLPAEALQAFLPRLKAACEAYRGEFVDLQLIRDYVPPWLSVLVVCICVGTMSALCVGWIENVIPNKDGLLCRFFFALFFARSRRTSCI
jgi:hypothetical protein